MQQKFGLRLGTLLHGYDIIQLPLLTLNEASLCVRRNNQQLCADKSCSWQYSRENKKPGARALRRCCVFVSAQREKNEGIGCCNSSNFVYFLKSN